MKGVMKMKTKLTVLMMVCVLAALLTGCSSKEQVKTGFLTDYSNLEIESDNALVYLNKQELGRYDKFIIDPIQARLYEDLDISKDELDLLRQYMYKAIFIEIEKQREVVKKPDHGVARLRIALTNLEESNVALNVIPHTKLTGLGLGAASMEAECLDSITGEQIAAVVRSQKGNQFSLDGYSKWSDARSIIDKWAKRWGNLLAETE
jgi:hypothetical protein